MYLYLAYLLSPVLIRVFLGLIPTFSQKQRNRILFNTMCILMFSFIGFRSQYIGSGDAQVYYATWERFSSTNDFFAALSTSSMEHGFLLFVYIFSHVFHSGQFVFLFSALIITYCVSSFIKENCKNYMLAFLVMNAMGLFTFFLQGLRQSIAIAICLYAVRYCRRKKLLKFLLCGILAMMFHGSAVVFLPVYLIYGHEINIKTIALISICTIVLMAFLDRFIGIVNLILNDSYAVGATNLTTGGTQTMLIYIGILIFAIAFHPVDADSERFCDYSFFLTLTYLALLFFSMRFYVNTIIERMSYYFILFVPCLLTNCVDRNRNINLLYFAVYSVFTFLAVYKGMTTSSFIPFVFFWQI